MIERLEDRDAGRSEVQGEIVRLGQELRGEHLFKGKDFDDPATVVALNRSTGKHFKGESKMDAFRSAKVLIPGESHKPSLQQPFIRAADRQHLLHPVRIVDRPRASRESVDVGSTGNLPPGQCGPPVDGKLTPRVERLAP